MSEPRCRSCRFYAPGTAFPDYERRGDCQLIHASGSTAERLARIIPAGASWLNVSANFGCVNHEERRS